MYLIYRLSDYRFVMDHNDCPDVFTHLHDAKRFALDLSNRTNIAHAVVERKGHIAFKMTAIWEDDPCQSR